MAKQLHITVITPTAINVIGVVHQNIVSNLRRKQPSDIELPSMYRRAFMMTYETGEILTTDDIKEE
jgi:hypothetical protein